MQVSLDQATVVFCFVEHAIDFDMKIVKQKFLLRTWLPV